MLNVQTRRIHRAPLVACPGRTLANEQTGRNPAVDARFTKRYYGQMRNTGTIVGVGIDMVEISEIKQARFKKRVAEYFLTKKEMTEIPSGRMAPRYLASRFAAKEAIIKAFPGKLLPHQFIIEKEGGKPLAVFSSPTQNKKYAIFISITHTATTAGAVAVITHRATEQKNG